MGLTKRQSEAIEKIIIEESLAAHRSQHDRHRILSEVDDPGTVTEARAQVLSNSIAGALDDLMESFVGSNRVYEGVEFDRGMARTRAVRYLRRLIENDLKEVQQQLQEGDFDGMDQETAPPMSMDQGYDDLDQNYGMDQDAMPAGGGGGSSPMPSGGMDQGYDMDQDDGLPPMHPRGREERSTMKPGKVSVGGPPPKSPGMRDSLPDPGYGGGGDEPVDVPPMHPRGRR